MATSRRGGLGRDAFSAYQDIRPGNISFQSGGDTRFTFIDYDFSNTAGVASSTRRTQPPSLFSQQPIGFVSRYQPDVFAQHHQPSAMTELLLETQGRRTEEEQLQQRGNRIRFTEVMGAFSPQQRSRLVQAIITGVGLESVIEQFSHIDTTTRLPEESISEAITRAQRAQAGQMFGRVIESMRTERQQGYQLAASGLFAQRTNVGTARLNAAAMERMQSDLPVIGNLSFRIRELTPALPGPVYGTGTHRLSVIVNGREQHQIELKSEHIQLIVDNIGDINALKNIFEHITGGPGITVVAREILMSLTNAEREAGPRGPRISDLD